jgi:D-alanyl-D-alanine carboxypeptidase/D-alanyl-D-alanine-endopeptidase (penicillin-binding protein 4)
MGKNTPSLSRRWVLAGLLTGAADVALANAPRTSLIPPPRPGSAPSVRRAPRAASYEALITDAKLGGKVGFVVANAKTGEILESHNPVLPMPPASTAKAITALYALRTLGLGYRYKTRLVATGAVSNGRLNGDLVLVGSGDPTLDTNALADMAARLKQAGIREITGDFLTYGRALPSVKSIDPDQPEHVGYSPAVSGLNLNYNRVHFEWKRAGSGYNVTMDARSAKYRPDVSMSRMTVVDRNLPVYTYDSTRGVDQWTVARGALGKGGARWLPVRAPDAYCADVFRTFARSQGIQLPRAKDTKSMPKGKTIAEWTSPELARIVRDMLKFSTNLTAEAVGLTASARLGANPGSLRSSGKRMSDWLGDKTSVKRASFVDHSGLGDASRISASEMVRALVALSSSAGLMPLLKEVPMRDANNKPVKNHPVKIRAKTGTLNFVSALTGFVTAPDGTELAFAIFTGDVKRRAGLKKAERERPQGGRSWNRRSRTLQLKLIERWATVYTS